LRAECRLVDARRTVAGLAVLLFYLLLAGVGEELAAAGGASIAPARANASIAIFQVPFSRFSILNQLPWMVLSLTVTE
jgi:hypothetical protein